MSDREPRPTMILRLLSEAQVGKACEVSIVDALDFRRDQYGLTRAEFAAILGMTSAHFSEVIAGKRNLPLNARIRAYAIGVPAEVLLQPGSEMVRRDLKSQKGQHDQN